MVKNLAEIEKHLIEAILKNSNGRLKRDQVVLGAHMFDELMLDSMEYALTLFSCEEALGVRVADRNVDWAILTTVGGLAEFLHAQQE